MALLDPLDAGSIHWQGPRRPGRGRAFLPQTGDLPSPTARALGRNRGRQPAMTLSRSRPTLASRSIERRAVDFCATWAESPRSWTSRVATSPAARPRSSRSSAPSSSSRPCCSSTSRRPRSIRARPRPSRDCSTAGWPRTPMRGPWSGSVTTRDQTLRVTRRRLTLRSGQLEPETGNGQALS